ADLIHKVLLKSVQAVFVGYGVFEEVVDAIVRSDLAHEVIYHLRDPLLFSQLVVERRRPLGFGDCSAAQSHDQQQNYGVVHGFRKHGVSPRRHKKIEFQTRVLIAKGYTRPRAMTTGCDGSKVNAYFLSIRIRAGAWSAGPGR